MDLGIGEDFKEYINSKGSSLESILQKLRVYLIQIKEKCEDLKRDQKQVDSTSRKRKSTAGANVSSDQQHKVKKAKNNTEQKHLKPLRWLQAI